MKKEYLCELIKECLQRMEESVIYIVEDQDKVKNPQRSSKAHLLNSLPWCQLFHLGIVARRRITATTTSRASCGKSIYMTIPKNGCNRKVCGK